MHLKGKLYKFAEVFFYNYTFFLSFYAILIIMALIPYYENGAVILGGEGNYVLDFSEHLQKFGYLWFPTYNTGMPNLSPSGTGLNIIFLYLIENLTKSAAVTNFVLIFSIYFFPFLAVFLAAKELKLSPALSFIASFFYVVNPFTLYYLICLNQWNVFVITVMPLFFWLILKNYHNNFKFFSYFGLISACFSFAYTNIPFLAIIHFSILLSVLFVSYYYNKAFVMRQILGKYSVVLTSFILFNLWWILGLFKTISDAKKIYTRSFAESWLNETVGDWGQLIITEVFSLRMIITQRTDYDFYSFWYNSPIAIIATLVPILIVVFLVAIGNKKNNNILNVFVLGVLLIVLFLIKGNAMPFGFIYTLLFKYVPFFYIFKTPIEKFSILYIFILSMLLLFVIRELNWHKYYKPVVWLFVAYLIFCSIPVVIGGIIPDYDVGNWGKVSRKYKDKSEYKILRETINSDDFEYRILSLPGNGNYQVLMFDADQRAYTGLDPLLMNTNKPLIPAYSGIDGMNFLLFENISTSYYEKLFGIYNIGKIIINEDLEPWFGFVEKEGAPALKDIFNDKGMPFQRWGNVTVYDNNSNFLPRIYAAGY